MFAVSPMRGGAQEPVFWYKLPETRSITTSRIYHASSEQHNQQHTCLCKSDPFLVILTPRVETLVQLIFDPR